MNLQSSLSFAVFWCNRVLCESAAFLASSYQSGNTYRLYLKINTLRNEDSKCLLFIADLSLAIKISYRLTFPNTEIAAHSAQQVVSIYVLVFILYFILMYHDEFSVCASQLTSHFVCAVMRTGLWLLRCCRTLVLCCDLQPVLWFWTAPDSVYSITTNDSYLLKHQQFLQESTQAHVGYAFFNFQLKPRLSIAYYFIIRLAINSFFVKLTVLCQEISH